MNISLVIFIVSGIAIILFFLIKIYQERSGKLVVVPHARENVEVTLRHWLGSLSQTKSDTIAALPHMPKRIVAKSKSLAVAFEKKIDSNTRNLPSLIRGRQNISRGGKVSSHIQHMLDDRNSSESSSATRGPFENKGAENM